MSIVRAAVVQDSPVVFNRRATIDKVASLVGQAASQGAKLVLLPEAFVSAYPTGLDFGTRVGFRDPRGREDFRRYFESAVEVPGPACDALGEVARQTGTLVVIGVIERGGSTLYCTVLFFSPQGKLMGKHRKLMPTASERLIWGFGDGSTLPVFETGPGADRKRHLLGELHAPAAHAHVRPGRPALLRAHGRFARHLASLDAPHRHGGPMLCPERVSISHPGRLPCGLRGDPGRRPVHGPHAGRELHHRPPGPGSGRAPFR